MCIAITCQFVSQAFLLFRRTSHDDVSAHVAVSLPLEAEVDEGMAQCFLADLRRYVDTDHLHGQTNGHEFALLTVCGCPEVPEHQFTFRA